MSRIPPNLLYLTIYNPTLHPTGPVLDDDEDAEEQAHILFYTSKERAVSRDRMLRQVGLAKALVKFSEMFSTESCDNIHSQSKRMIMVSPEPDFWIHAGVEVAKTPRTPIDKGKGKSKEKAKTPEKGKQLEKEPAPLYDYYEGSVHDIVLRQDILRGYERFKLTHGSFTSILSTLGQQALELQLERYFTVWAWSWNLEDGHEFRDHLGIPLHPSFRSIVPLLDEHSVEPPSGLASIFICPPYVVPSTYYTATNYPSSLTRHLISLIPPAPFSSQGVPACDHDGTIKAKRSSDPNSANGKDSPKNQESSPNTFLGMANVNMGVSMGNWNWPGYLTFGRGAGKRPVLENKTMDVPNDTREVDKTPLKDVDIDESALEDAISENISIPPSNASQVDLEDPLSILPQPDKANASASQNISTAEETQASHTRIPADSDSVSLAPSVAASATSVELPSPGPELSFTTIHLAEPNTSVLTTRQKVYYVLKNQMMLALVGLNDETVISTPKLARNVMTLLDKIESIIETETLQSSTDLLPSAAKILQPTDRHIVSTGHFTVSSPAFTSKSSHLYNARELQAMDPVILEVFSRGQNPQHWHVARRGLGTADDGTVNEGEVYMEVFRKEASLGDVDNVLAGVIKRCGLID